MADLAKFIGRLSSPQPQGTSAEAESFVDLQQQSPVPIVRAELPSSEQQPEQSSAVMKPQRLQSAPQALPEAVHVSLQSEEKEPTKTTGAATEHADDLAEYERLLQEQKDLNAEVEASRISKLGITAQELGFIETPPVRGRSSVHGSRSTGSVAVKYRDPETGNTWTGRGREPAWIKGKDRNQFLIELPLDQNPEYHFL